MYPVHKLSDVYDGDVWKQYMDVKDNKTLSTIAVMMNVDWFRPYKHLNYSVGVIYLAIMNLPREHHFKKENILPAGMIPGPKEPKHDMNSFSEPIVTELLKL